MSQIEGVIPQGRKIPGMIGHHELSCLGDREIENLLHFSTLEGASANSLEVRNTSGDGTRTLAGDDGMQHVSACFEGGAGSYQLRLVLAEKMRANGVGTRIRLRGWKRIDYIAVGYTLDGFQHVKAANPILDTWFDFVVGHNDLAWGWRNNWQRPDPCEISDIRLYIKGEPDQSGFLDVTDMYAFLESDTPWGAFAASASPIPARTMYAVRAYHKKAFRTYEEQARGFMERGICPLNGNINLEWPVEEPRPAEFMAASTHQFAFHAQHPATMLMLLAHDTGEAGPVFAARDYIDLWLERSFFAADENLKYTWYNHGTAERCMSMVQMYALGEEYGFDLRFMSRLRLAIFRHAQLLASEVFYVSHQSIRYHNHAWFQDMALLTVCCAFPGWPSAGYWRELAISRLADQFEQLIVRDSGYAVSIENSINYHDVIQRIVECVGNLVMLGGRDTKIPTLAYELLNFADFFRYPNTTRTAAQGDTFRLPNIDERARTVENIPYAETQVTVLPQAGYGVVKDNHEGIPFMLVMLATALSSTHKHEDNLSFTLYFDGLEWLIDPSFHSHEYAHPIPAYLRSSAAHNVLYLPGLNYSIEPFHAELRGTVESTAYSMEGAHDAYEDAHVTRRITGQAGVLDLAIADAVTLQRDAPQAGAIMLHCGEGVRAEVSGSTVTLSHPCSDYELQCEMPSERIEVKRGVVTDKQVRGITGLAFMRTADIDTVETSVDLGQVLNWRIRATSKSSV